MKKSHLLITVLISYTVPLLSQKVYLNTKENAHILTNSNSIITANNTSLTTSASFASQGVILFTGSQPSTLGGSKEPSLHTVIINKPDASLLMTGNINADHTIAFQNGLFDLNNYSLSLGTTGQLSNESETSHATGINGGTIAAKADNVNFPTGINIGNLGAVLSSSGSPGDVIITRSHKPFENPGNGSLTGIQRSYFIQPSNNTSLNATLRFYYLDAELNGKDENTLALWQSEDGVSWTNIGVDGRNTTANFVEKNSINSLSWFTLTDAANALPVRLLSFKATCQNNYTLLQWQTAFESNASQFTAEKSADGITWSVVETVAAINAATGASYSCQDHAPQATAYYRIRITDKNGSVSYSPIFSGGCSEVTRPVVVYPNPAHNSTTVSFAVRQSGNAVLQLYAANGQLLSVYKQAVSIGTNNITVPMAALPAGVYTIRLFINNQVVQSKLIKQ